MTALVGSIQHAADTEANWTTNNPVLLANQIYISTDVFYETTNCSKIKIGKGVNWVDTNYLPAGAATGGSSFWTALPAATRTSDSNFNIPDVGNAGKWSQKLCRKTILKWTDGGTKMAMVHDALYSADVVYLQIIGDPLTATADLNTLKYAIVKAEEIRLPIAGVIEVGNALGGRVYAATQLKIFGFDAFLVIAGTGGNTSFTISKNATDGTNSISDYPLTVGDGNTSGVGRTASNGMEALYGNYFVANCTAAPTNKPQDAYLYMYVCPLYIKQLT